MVHSLLFVVFPAYHRNLEKSFKKCKIVDTGFQGFFKIHAVYCCYKGGDGMRILMIEDDRALCAALRPALTQPGFAADFCHDGREGLSMLCTGAYDVCILDRMLPALDGLSLLRAARERGVAVPVLLLTALGGVGDKVDGLDAGADDYLIKPFDTRELLARLRALARRPAAAQSVLLRAGDLTLDPGQLTLAGPNGVAGLSRRECDLLETLLRAPDRLQSRTALLDRVWGPLSEVEEANLDCYIHFVRRRLSSVGSACRIVTVRGSGYKLSV